MQITDLGPARPPCSLGEREAADAVRARMRRLGLRPAIELARAPTSSTWAPLLRALLRVWAAAFLAAGLPAATIGLACASIVGGLPGVAGLIRFLPLLGATTTNVVAVKRGRRRDGRPIIACAHLDTHPTAGEPMRRAHVFLAGASGMLALVAGLAAQPGVAGWRWAAGLIAAESIFTLVWLGRHELVTPAEPPDDNTSGLLALTRLAELVSDVPPACEVWLVASGAGTSGSYGFISFLRKRKELRRAWVVDIDGLGSGEVIASPFPPRFPHPGTPSALVRAVVAAARSSGDPLTVRRTRRPHSDARAALRLRTPAIALTAGLRPPAGSPGPDPANAERAARVVDALARLER